MAMDNSNTQLDGSGGGHSNTLSGFLMKRGELPTWHKLYKTNSTELVEPFISGDSVDSAKWPSSNDYSPYMVMVESGNTFLRRFWKSSPKFQSKIGNLVYSGTTPGLGGCDTAHLQLVWANRGVWGTGNLHNQYLITREYNTTLGGYDLVITSLNTNNSHTFLTGKCPTCLYFEMLGAGGGGSAAVDMTGRNGGNGGAAGGFMAGIIDFSTATDGILIILGAPGKGGTYKTWQSTAVEARRASALGTKGGHSAIYDYNLYKTTTFGDYGFSIEGGEGGTVRPYDGVDWNIVTRAPSGGKYVKRVNTEGSNPSISVFPTSVGGIIILASNAGGAGGVHVNDWTTAQINKVGYPPTTDCSRKEIDLIPGDRDYQNESKVFPKRTGGITTSATTFEVTISGGGASQLYPAAANRDSDASPGTGGFGGYNYGDSSTYHGKDGGGGYFKLFYTDL